MKQLHLPVVLSVNLALIGLCSPAQAGTITFGSGANQFSMVFVEIGDAGNAADTTGSPNPAGAVSYVYQMGKYEVSRDMITKYNANFGTVNSLEITLRDMTSFGGNGADRPATGVSWNEAARFVNWLNTSQGYQAAYKFTTGGVDDNIALWVSGDTGFNAANPFRNSLAHYFLPSFDEWYKAAYYDPVSDTYFYFPNGSNTAPTAVTGGGIAGTAVYNQSTSQGPADITNAGGLSPFGIMGLGGNVWEWQETAHDLLNNSASSDRGIRGGDWLSLSGSLWSSSRGSLGPLVEGVNIGFRVASLSETAAVPEPSSLILVLTGVAGFGVRRWRRLRK
jgi:formylglycine-generating enzyme